MSQAKANRIANSYAEINKGIQTENYSKVIKAANRIINEERSEEEAWQCKVVAQVQSEQFAEALQTITKSPIEKQQQFERAYCLYRLQREQEALTVLQASPGHDLRHRELTAQIHYRLEQYAECHALYQQTAATRDDWAVERRANLAAAEVHLCETLKRPAPAAPPASASYEQVYNNACAATAAGAPADQCLKRLERAIELCRKTLKAEGCGEEEVEAETAPLRVQQGYVLQRAGRCAEAAVAYGAVGRQGVADAALAAVLCCNQAALEQGQAQGRRLRQAMSGPLEHKLPRRHLATLQRNAATLAVALQQRGVADPALEAQLAELRQGGEGGEAATLLLAASVAKAGRLEQALTLLEGAPGCAGARLGLTRAQIRLMKNDVVGAAAELAGLPPSHRHLPGVVAARAVLYAAKRKTDALDGMFDEIAQAYKDKKPTTRGEVAMLSRAAHSLTARGQHRAATDLWDALWRSEGDAYLPDLIAACSKVDPARADALAAGVRLPAGLLEACDAAALEARVAGAKQRDGAPSVKKARKKKKRKTILPKNYVAGSVPDPERWLPRWQRKKSGGRRRKAQRKRDQAVGKGTQGGTGDAADKYDITKNAGAYKSVYQPEPTGPRRNANKKKNRKK